MLDDHSNPARAIYGTILVMAVIVAFSHDDSATSAELIGAVAATTIVFWVAHVYAEVLGRRLGGESGSRMANIRAALGHEWPIVEAALLPVLALLLGVLSIVSDHTAVNIAIGVGVLELFGWGLAAGRKLGLSTTGTMLAGVTNGALGLVIVGLKVVVH
jgi:hypothetical protein